MDKLYDRALQLIIEGYDGILDPTIELIAEDSLKNPYRLATVPINGETIVEFSKPFLNDNYYLTIKRYTATNGTIVEYGWDIINETRESFTFIPPTRFLTGELTYEAHYFN